jgi:hypothetical protein
LANPALPYSDLPFIGKWLCGNWGTGEGRFFGIVNMIDDWNTEIMFTMKI